MPELWLGSGEDSPVCLGSPEGPVVDALWNSRCRQSVLGWDLKGRVAGIRAPSTPAGAPRGVKVGPFRGLCGEDSSPLVRHFSPSLRYPL